MAFDRELWKHFARQSFENEMGSTTKNLYNAPTLTSQEQVDTEENNMSDISIPDLEAFTEPTEAPEDTSVKDESGGSVVYGVIGAGQAGGRLAEAFYGLGYKKCLAVNTAQNDLNGLSLPEAHKMLLAVDTGGGAGKDMSKGEEAALRAQQSVYERLQQLFGKVDRILICAGAGGGTGSGSVLPLIEVAKKYLLYTGVSDVGRRVGVFLSLPTAGECATPRVSDNATTITGKLCELATQGLLAPLVLVDNQKIASLYPKLTVAQFWPTVNQLVTGLFHSFNVLSTKDGCPTSFDPADYQTVLNTGGCSIMGLTSVKSVQDGSEISKAIRESLENTLLCSGFDIRTTRAAACIAVGSEKMLNETPGLMLSLENGFDTLANITGDATVFRGIYQGDKDKLLIYTMLCGLAAPIKRIEDFKRFRK